MLSFAENIRPPSPPTPFYSSVYWVKAAPRHRPEPQRGRHEACFIHCSVPNAWSHGRHIVGGRGYLCIEGEMLILLPGVSPQKGLRRANNDT